MSGRNPYRHLAAHAISALLLVLIWLPVTWHFTGPFFQPLAAELQTPDLPLAARPCITDQCDFMAFWAAGRLGRAGQTGAIYDPDIFEAWQRHNVGPNKPSTPWIYPPPALILPYLAAGFPFGAAYLLWSCGLVAASILVLRAALVPWLVIAAGIFSLPALLTLRLGQFGLLTSALFISGLTLTARRPPVAGALLGLLIIKPQAGLLAPVVFVAGRFWRALAAAAAIAVFLCAVVTILFGPLAWRDFLAVSLKTAKILLDAPFPTRYNITGVSVFWMLRSFGWSVAAANVVQAVAAIAATAFCWRLWRRPQADPTTRVALTTLLTLLVSPYGFIGDMCGYCVAIALLARRDQRLRVTDTLLWLAPCLCLVIGFGFHVVVAPIAVLLAILRAARPAAASIS